MPFTTASLVRSCQQIGVSFRLLVALAGGSALVDIGKIEVRTLSVNDYAVWVFSSFSHARVRFLAFSRTSRWEWCRSVARLSSPSLMSSICSGLNTIVFASWLPLTFCDIARCFPFSIIRRLRSTVDGFESLKQLSWL